MTKGRKSITILPLDITRELILTEDLIRQITQHETLKQLTAHMAPDSPYPCNEVGRAMFLADLASFLIKSNMAFRCTRGHTGFLVHDAVTLAFLFYPETIKLTRGRVKVLCLSNLQFNRTGGRLNHYID